MDRIDLLGLTGASATLLITLYGKAVESRAPHSVLHDHFADDAVHRLGADLSRLWVGKGTALGFAIRAKWFDDHVRDFIGRHRDAIVLNLGCGLDSRIYRVDPPPEIRWFDVDFPAVMALHERIYPPRQGYRRVASCVTDPAWLDAIPNDGPAIILGEGLFPYLAADSVVPLLRRLVGRFRSGELLFDGYSRFGLKMIHLVPAIKLTGAIVHWSIGKGSELETAVPPLRCMEESSGYGRKFLARQPWYSRLFIRAWMSVPALRHMGRLLRYRFDHDG